MKNRISRSVVLCDVLDNTPLLDIKPYVPDFDAQSDVRTGWLSQVQKSATGRKSDDRFSR